MYNDRSSLCWLLISAFCDLRALQTLSIYLISNKAKSTNSKKAVLANALKTGSSIRPTENIT